MHRRIVRPAKGSQLTTATPINRQPDSDSNHVAVPVNRSDVRRVTSTPPMIAAKTRTSPVRTILFVIPSIIIMFPCMIPVPLDGRPFLRRARGANS
jgi:hypothetical protein